MLIVGVNHLQKGIKVHVPCPADFDINSILILSARKRFTFLRSSAQNFYCSKPKMLGVQGEMNDIW